MAKRKAARARGKAKGKRKSASTRRSVERPTRKAKAKARPAKRLKRAPSAVKRRTARKKTTSGRSAPPRIERARRVLDDGVPTPPSSLSLERRSSAARSGQAEMIESRKAHANMTPAITGGDVDANVESAYFSGDEAPGGDNPTPDQDVVDDIGRALGVEYQDAEELKGSDKVAARDRHRWELDPASAEDYKDRK